MSDESPANPPMGRLEAFEAGSRKVTIQTEFFARPAWRIETKIYVGGELKKVHTEEMTGVAESELQTRLNDFHQRKAGELWAKFQGLKKD